MEITINSVHFKMDVKLEDFINQRVEKVCTRYSDVIGVDVTLKLDNTDTPENKIANVRIILKGNDLFAEKKSKTFEESVDTALDALKKQLEKSKNKAGF